MARNEEKANALLNRYLAMKAEERQLSQPERRPYDVNECSDIAKGAHWRDQIIQEIAKKMTLIQNEALGEIKIRELNDSLNKLLLEKWKWEKRIFELGGTNYNDDPNPPKYQFFGAAKNLSGVKELLESKKAEKKARSFNELNSMIDYEYYGYLDEDNPELLSAEADAERLALKESFGS